MKNLLTCILISSFVFSCTPEKEEAPAPQPAPQTAPAPPSLLKVSSDNPEAIVLNWKDNASNEDGFEIQRKSGDGDFLKISPMYANTTRYTDNVIEVDSTYTYRVRAYNSTGNSSFTNEAQITIYSFVTIGDKKWMKRNLDVDHYRNGDVIPQVTDPTEWAGLTTGAWCYYQNKTANGVIYGKLYNWYAVNDPRGLAPEGWHVATNAEWDAVTEGLGGATVAGGPMKSTEHWTSPNTGATNSSGFTALGGGARIANAAFSNLGTWGAWWTADNDEGDISFYRILYNNNTKSEVYHIYNSYGMSVRCVKNQ
jgi:uncharacterized protein (TIGR02145 family)